MSQSQSQTSPEGPTAALKSMSRFALDIESTNTVPFNGVLLNRFEQPDSKIISIHAHLARYDRDVDDYVDYTPEELAQPGFVGKTMTLESVWEDMDSGEIVAETRKTYNNEKGFFTIKEVVEAVEDFERINRPKSKWFGGVDCNHIFFEGLWRRKSGAYGISWGS